MYKKNKLNLYHEARTLLIIGIICIVIASLIQLIFIRSTDFKQKYQSKQFDQCILKNKVEICRKNFPLAK